MSTRLLASIGIVLCVAMTTFSIYLGVIENIYGKTSYSHHTLSYLAVGSGRVEDVCIGVPRPSKTTTTSAPSSSPFMTAGNGHCA